jgi:hypothetical protein
MTALFRLLNDSQPPNLSYASAVRRSVYISVFVAVFLVAFQPFGLGMLEGDYRLLLIASYGLPCFLPNVIIGCGLVYWGRSRKKPTVWRVWHELAVILLHMLVIGISNYLYGVSLSFFEANGSALMEMLVYTMLVGFFPAAAVFVSNRAINISRNETAAASLNRTIETTARHQDTPTAASAAPVTLSGENRGETFSVLPDELCYMKSDGNYVEVVTAAPDAKRQTQLLRATLKDMETQLSGQCAEIVRCHRSYLVNARRIVAAEGNSAGLVITLDRDGIQVPVSRAYVAAFRK